MRLRSGLAACAAALMGFGVASADAATPGWSVYAPVTERPAGFVPRALAAEEFVDVDFGREVAGHLIVRFGDVVPGSIVAVSFSETGGHLHSGTSDYSRREPVDRRMPAPARRGGTSPVAS